MRRSTLFFSLLTLIIGFMVFRVKYEVMALEQNNRQVSRSIQETKEAIHILKAEKAHLSDPKRLQKLAYNNLDLQPIKAKQIVELSQLPTSKVEKDEEVTIDNSIDNTENQSSANKHNSKSKQVAKSPIVNQKKIDPLDNLINKINKKEGL